MIFNLRLFKPAHPLFRLEKKRVQEGQLIERRQPELRQRRGVAELNRQGKHMLSTGCLLFFLFFSFFFLSLSRWLVRRSGEVEIEVKKGNEARGGKKEGS